MNEKGKYLDRFGLPEEQLRFFGELTPGQVEEVRRQFSAALVGVEDYIYAVRRDGTLVPARERRNIL